MTINEAILFVLSDTYHNPTTDVINLVQNLDWPECDPTAKDIVDALQAMEKQHIVAHLMAHSVSLWRRLTTREVSEWQAEQSGD